MCVHVYVCVYMCTYMHMGVSDRDEDVVRVN